MKDEVTKTPPGDFPYPFSNERDSMHVILNETTVPLLMRDKTLPKSQCAAIEQASSVDRNRRFRNADRTIAALQRALRA